MMKISCGKAPLKGFRKESCSQRNSFSFSLGVFLLKLLTAPVRRLAVSRTAASSCSHAIGLRPARASVASRSRSILL
ncbi:uncharacterized [Tachysurus ichikawai]